MTKRRSLSATVSAVIDECRLEKYLQRSRTYLCTHCSKGTFTEIVVRPSELRIIDEQVHRVVAYKVSCPSNSTKKLYDKMPRCYIGNNKAPRESSCATCKHAEPTTVLARPAQVNQYRVDCRCYRTLYRCTNQRRMEHFPKGTHMCSYISCEHYEPKKEMGSDA